MSRGLVNNMLTMNNLGDGSTLSLDFTTMGGVLDPRLTFSRASTATFVNSSGYVDHAGANLQPYSQDQSQIGTWVRQDLSGVDANVVATTDPNGGSNASKIKSAASLQAHLVYSTISTSISSGLAYTFSVYVKKAELKYFAIHLASTARYTVIFDLDTGVMTATNSTGTPLGTSYSSSNAGNGWWRLSATMIAQSTTIYPHLCLSNSGTPSVNASGQPYYLGTLNDGVYTWGAQLNPGSTAQTYYPTTTAAYHAPRFDYSPTNIGEPRGLLIEGQAANVCSYSEDFANAAWTKSGIAQTPASGTSPDNSNTATLIAENAGGFIKHSLERSVTVTAGSVYTWSVFLKEASSNSRRYACVQVADGQAIAARNTVVFDLQTGTVTANGVNNGTAGAPTDVAHSITSYRDGWYRVSVTMKYVASPCYPTVILSDISTLYGGSNQPFYTATVPYKSLLVYGGQLELGSGASSYIPTGASGVTRTVDTCYMSGISSWYNESAGTVISNITYDGLATDNSGIELSVGTGSSPTNRIGIRKGYVDYYSGGVNSAEMYPTVTSGNVRIGTAYSLNDFAMCSNGGTMRTDGSGAVPVGLNTLKLYADNGTSGLVLNGLIKSIKYFPTRLSNAQLQTLTAP
jgi:hypothetical protein